MGVQVISTNSVGEPIGTFSSSNSQDAIANPGVGDTWFGSTDHRETTRICRVHGGDLEGDG